jgi:putative membrane protein
MRSHLLILGSSLIALAACSNSTTSNTTADVGNAAGGAMGAAEDTAAAGVGMVQAPLANTADAYVTNAAIGDMYEIESSKLAQQKAQSAVKKFAQQMITDHTATTAKLKATIAEAGLQLMPPTKLDARRQGMLDNLSSLSGAAFDTAYLDQQTAAHQEALALHTGFAQDGDNEPLKKLAAATAPKIQHHYEMVQQLDKQGDGAPR